MANPCRMASLLTIVVVATIGCPMGNKQTLVFEGKTRTYTLHVPAMHSVKTPMPLAVLLHPAFLSGDRMQRLTGFNRIADQYGYIVAYPDGVRRVWNLESESDGRPLGGSRANDAGFIHALIDDLQQRYPIDPTRIYIAGASAGSMLTHRLVTQSPRFAAAATVMGTFPQKLLTQDASQRPIPMLIIHGTDDRIVPYAGGNVNLGPGASINLLSAPDTATHYAARNLCERPTKPATLIDADPADGTRTHRTLYPNGRDGATVVLYAVEGGGHTWPGQASTLLTFLIGRISRDFSASEAIGAFFAAHPTPSPAPPPP